MTVRRCLRSSGEDVQEALVDGEEKGGNEAREESGYYLGSAKKPTKNID